MSDAEHGTPEAIEPGTTSDTTHNTAPAAPGAGVSGVPSQYLTGAQASAPRTLVDILRATAEQYPSAAAIDDGEVLTYAELIHEAQATAEFLASVGVGRGARVGVRLPSGGRDLYIAIVGTLWAGAAYVPVDADDPQERADVVFSQAQVDAVFTPDGVRVMGGPRPPVATSEPGVGDDAWIIFTSGSTGLPKGVAVSHRSAAAFVDAEAQLFCQDAPLGPEDRVLAGLSVAFDASCEEMWLAWRHGACLVPAPRSLVRSGMDLGPWLASRDISVISTVPTLASMWPLETLESVRLMIFGGEACPPELVARLGAGDRQLWNTYGPTEATVVACAAPLVPGREVSIGLPLAGWDLAVVDEQGLPVPVGATGELIIGGVGLARYLDEEKDRQVYAPLPSLGWARAYRSGDVVRLEEDGLYFVGRRDDQVKIGGRRIELGEVTAQVSAASGVKAAVVVVRTTDAGDKALVGYVSPKDPANVEDPAWVGAVREELSSRLPAALVPRLCVLESLPVTTSGKVDKKALPWPLPGADLHAEGLSPAQLVVAQAWASAVGVAPADGDADFFALGGTSLAAAAVVSQVRRVVPRLSVRDVYDYPRLDAFADRLVALGLDEDAVRQNSVDADPSSAASGETSAGAATSAVAVVPIAAQAAQWMILAATVAVRACVWVAWVVLGLWVAGAVGGSGFGAASPGAGVGVGAAPWWPAVPGTAALAAAVFLLPPVRMALSALGARLLTAGLVPGEYPRASAVHVRVWAAERLQEALGAHGLGGAVWMNLYARALGCRVGRGVTLHTVPPVTGMADLGDYCALAPEVDILGHHVAGDRFVLGRVTVGARARVDARAVLSPGAVVADGAHVEAAAHVDSSTTVKPQARVAGSPAHRVGRPKRTFPTEPPPPNRRWVVGHALASAVAGAHPVLAVAAAVAVVVACIPASVSARAAAGWALMCAPLATVVGLGVYAAITIVLVRLCQRGLDEEIHPVRSSHGVRLWLVWRLMDDARRHLFPLYAALATPTWLRLLGTKIGHDAEVSTAVLIPGLTDIRDETFCADDTQLGGYELGTGWIRTGRVKVGRRSFVGNSGMVAPGRKVRKNSLIAVLSQAPKKAKGGSDWMGVPPVRLRRVAVCSADGELRTYQPPIKLKAARATVETLRLAAPMTSGLLAAGVVCLMLWGLKLTGSLWGLWLGAVAALPTAALAALLITTGMKWACVGRIRPGTHALWTPFIWLNELQDAFVESVLAVWLVGKAPGTPIVSIALRALGARIGRGCWLESYWLPEVDLCTLGNGVSINRGCVVQTHLFQDRVMALDGVQLAAGASMGPHSVILPAASLGTGTHLGPASLVMRGDHLPPHSTWVGNTVEPA